MPDSLGTRIKATMQQIELDQGAPNGSYTRDQGMTKLIIDNFTFNAATHQITGTIAGEFSVFAVDDPLMVQFTNLNNGFYNIDAVDPAGNYLTLDPPPKNEGPITATIRTP
jgi:hypothetical protein